MIVKFWNVVPTGKETGRNNYGNGKESVNKEILFCSWHKIKESKYRSLQKQW